MAEAGGTDRLIAYETMHGWEWERVDVDGNVLDTSSFPRIHPGAAINSAHRRYPKVGRVEIDRSGPRFVPGESGLLWG